MNRRFAVRLGAANWVIDLNDGKIECSELEWEESVGVDDELVPGLNVFHGIIFNVDATTSVTDRELYGVPDGFVGEWWCGEWQKATAEEAIDIGFVAP